MEFIVLGTLSTNGGHRNIIMSEKQYSWKMKYI